jgi:flagellar protein FliS
MNSLAQRQAFSAYGQAAQTVAPAQQIVMLYDGAIRRLLEAKDAIAEQRTEDRFNLVQKATAIIDALHGCLDFQNGGEIAQLLDRFYTYVAYRLQQINIMNDPSICDEVVDRLSEMRASWASVANGTGAPSAPPAVPSIQGGMSFST